MSITPPTVAAGRSATAAYRSARAARHAERAHRSIYAHCPVPGRHRNLREPRVERHWRPKELSWAGPAVFFRNRFYERDRWYKARIDVPARPPDLKLITPSHFYRSLDERLKGRLFHDEHSYVRSR